MSEKMLEPKEKLEVVKKVLDILEKEAPENSHMEILSLTLKAISGAAEVTIGAAI